MSTPAEQQTRIDELEAQLRRTEIERDEARAAVAGAWDQGWNSGLLDLESQFAGPRRNATPNPYRSESAA